VKLNLGSGAHPLEGFENLDLDNGWRFQDGLPYPDSSVEGVTISHALYLVPIADWPVAFSEIARVLQPGGVVRITEDATDDPASERYPFGFDGVVTLTSASRVAEHMLLAGLWASTWPSMLSQFRDGSLIQNHHGTPPKVFHIEGVKP
jgi:hypothetical protein